MAPRVIPPLAGGVLLASVVGSVAPPVGAFRTAGDLPAFADTQRVRWQSPVVEYVRSVPTPTEFSAEQIQSTLSRAFGAWSGHECGGVTFEDRGLVAVPAAPEDGANTVMWVDRQWEDLGAPPDAPALTDVQYIRSNEQWRIAEVDLYLNAEHHDWSLAGGEGEARSLLSVATHESGHMIGLLHPCEFAGADGAPDCGDVAEARTATMYPAYGHGQMLLSTDDKAGLCFLYPESTADGSIVTKPPSAGLLGDPCVDSDNCSEGACSSDGYCRSACRSDADCAGDSYCDPSSIPGTCFDARGPLGAVCAGSADCLGSQCLAGAVGEPMCTRLCDSDAPCPTAWECVTVDDRDVCVSKPELVPTGGVGCHVAAAPISSSGSWSLIGILTFTALRRVAPRGSLFARASACWSRLRSLQTEDRGVV